MGPGWAKAGWAGIPDGPDGQECRMGRMESRWAKSGWSPDGQECRMGWMGHTGWIPDGFQLPSQGPVNETQGLGAGLSGQQKSGIGVRCSGLALFVS